MLYSSMGPFGGSELRAWRLARSAAVRQLGAVSMIGFDAGQPARQLRDGVLHLRDHTQVLGTSRWRRWRGYAARRWRETLVCRRPSIMAWESAAWASVNAQIYVTFGVTAYSAKLAWWAKAQGRACLLMLGSEMDLDPQEPDATTAYENASMVVAQTSYQQRQVQARFGRTTELLRNPVNVPELAPSTLRQGFLWVGKSNNIKRPSLMVDVAKLMPEHRFTLVMNKADEAVAAEVRRVFPANVQVVDSVMPQEIWRLYGQAVALVSTSCIEGFANTFLEAAACHTPVVSMVSDPDGFLSERGCGVLTGESPASVAAALRSLVSVDGVMSADWQRMGQKGRSYVQQWHSAPVIEAAFASLVAECATRSAARKT
jgi:glycosyltransferase involved in cell wall biosynthesis